MHSMNENEKRIWNNSTFLAFSIPTQKMNSVTIPTVPINSNELFFLVYPRNELNLNLRHPIIYIQIYIYYTIYIYTTRKEKGNNIYSDVCSPIHNSGSVNCQTAAKYIKTFYKEFNVIFIVIKIKRKLYWTKTLFFYRIIWCIIYNFNRYYQSWLFSILFSW